MKRLNLLLGNAEDVVNDLLEATVHEVCGEDAEVNCIRTGRLDDFIQKGCNPEFDLIILIPNNLTSTGPVVPGSSAIGVSAIQAIKSHCPTPVIALPAFEAREQEEGPIWRAGADFVLELPFNRDELKSAIARLLKVLPEAEAATVSTEPAVAAA